MSARSSLEITSMWSKFAALFRNTSSRRRSARRGSGLPVEMLEVRRVLTTFVVDDFAAFQNVAQHRYDTIQEAVDAASAGDRIDVRAGTYNENVLVNKSLTITGAGNNTIVDPVSDGLLTGPVSGFNLQADNVTIKGFRIGDINGDTSVAGGDGSVGISTSSSFSGYKIQNNLIERNTIGIYLNTTTVGARLTEVSNNTIQDNNVGFGVLPAAGNGIYSDQGLRNVRISNNTLQRHGNEEIIFVGQPDTQFQISVERNTLRDGSGIFFLNVNSSQIVNNTITRSAFNGIELGGNDHGILVQGNRLENVGLQGYTGIYLNDNNAAGPNVANVIQNNTVINAGLSGIRVRDSNFNVVSNNTVTGTRGIFLDDPAWGNGITIENGVGNTIDGNRVKQSARHGIYVDATSTNNRITANNSTQNAYKVPGAFDYDDESPNNPPLNGTFGTSNTYRNNTGRTQNKFGLIRH